MPLVEALENLIFTTDIESPVNVKVCVEILASIAKDSDDINDFKEQLDDKEFQTRLKNKYKKDLGVWLQSGQIEELSKLTFIHINREVAKSNFTGKKIDVDKFFELFHK